MGNSHFASRWWVLLFHSLFEAMTHGQETEKISYIFSNFLITASYAKEIKTPKLLISFRCIVLLDGKENGSCSQQNFDKHYPTMDNSNWVYRLPATRATLHQITGGVEANRRWCGPRWKQLQCRLFDNTSGPLNLKNIRR